MPRELGDEVDGVVEVVKSHQRIRRVEVAHRQRDNPGHDAATTALDRAGVRAAAEGNSVLPGDQVLVGQFGDGPDGRAAA